MIISSFEEHLLSWLFIDYVAVKLDLSIKWSILSVCPIHTLFDIYLSIILLRQLKFAQLLAVRR